MILTDQVLRRLLTRATKMNDTRAVFVTDAGAYEVMGVGPPQKRPFLAPWGWTAHPEDPVEGRRILRIFRSADGEWFCELEGDVWITYELMALAHSPKPIFGRGIFVYGPGLDDERRVAFSREPQVSW